MQRPLYKDLDNIPYTAADLDLEARRALRGGMGDFDLAQVLKHRKMDS